MKGRKTILVTGSTGLLGKGLAETAPPNYRIIGVHSRDYTVEDTRVKHITLDIRDQRKVRSLFKKYHFDTILHAAGIASVDYVEKHYAESYESNLLGTLNITAAARKAGSHLIYVSTNAVFDGRKPPYKETDPINPVNKYGRIKVECEKVVSGTLEDYAIFRPILMYGWNHSVCRPNPATWIFEKLMRGEGISMVDDVYENPLYNLACGEVLWALIRKKSPGIFHAGGSESINRYRFALKVAKIFGLDPKLIKRVKSSHFKSIARRPKNTTFDVRRMKKVLGVKAWSVEEGLRSMKENMRVKT